MSRAVAAELRMVMAGRDEPIMQKDISAASGVPQSTLSRLLRGDKVIDIEQLVSVCQALGIDAGAVLDRAAARVNPRAVEDEAPAEDAPESPAPVDTRQVPAREAHAPTRSGARDSASTRRHRNH